ncbi:hypothetical protein [Streptomyces sp. NBC_01006]|uniref:hypothetical protein n=1 Tax=Streptomyces sp. NBC_01006 TaxID=2903716 RepID=UPI002F90CA51|nr:hypothetical protein OG509_40460 [Streptomyces sp. NBC_01006]
MLRARFAPIAAKTAALALAALFVLPAGGAATATVLADGPIAPAATQPAPGTGTGGTGTGTGTGTGDDMGWG